MAGTTADAFDAALLRRCYWPSANAPLTQAERLAVADEEISGMLFPKLIAAHADYYLSTIDHAITAGYSRYRLPTNHFGPAKDLKLLTAEDVAAGKDGRNLDLININELGRRTSCGIAAFVDGDFIGLDPVPDTTIGTLRIRYYRQPSSLLLSTAATRIADTLNLVDQPLRIPATAALSPAPSSGDLLDVVSAGNAHQLLLDGAELDTITASVNYNFVSGTALEGSGIQPGDWLAPAGFTPVVPLPDFVVPAAIRWVAAACLQAAGDARFAAETAKAQQQLDLALRLATPRVEDEPPVTRSRYSPFRRWAR